MEIGSSDELINQALSIGCSGRLMMPLNWNGRLNKIPFWGRVERPRSRKLVSGRRGKCLGVENVDIERTHNIDKAGHYLTEHDSKNHLYLFPNFVLFSCRRKNHARMI